MILYCSLTFYHNYIYIAKLQQLLSILFSDAIAYSSAYYGQGTVPILLDDVRCTNTESRLIDCPYTAIDNCAHYEDAALSCTTSNIAS